MLQVLVVHIGGAGPLIIDISGVVIGILDIKLQGIEIGEVHTVLTLDESVLISEPLPVLKDISDDGTGQTSVRLVVVSVYVPCSILEGLVERCLYTISCDIAILSVCSGVVCRHSVLEQSSVLEGVIAARSDNLGVGTYGIVPRQFTLPEDGG